MNARLASLAALFAFAGCASIGSVAPNTVTAPRERLRVVGPLGLAKAAEEVVAAKTATPADELSLTVEAARATAIENNLDLRVELVNPAIAALRVGEEEARFEALFFANGSFTKTDTPGVGGASGVRMESTRGDLGVELPLTTGGTLTFEAPLARSDVENAGSTLNPAYAADFSASIVQPLFRDAGVRTNTYGIRIARYDSEISQARSKLEVTRVVAEVDAAYWRLYAARRELEVRRNEHELAVTQLGRASRRAEAGAATELDVVSAETGVAERLEAIIVAESALRQRERDLKRILNMPAVGLETPTVIVTAAQAEPVRFELEAMALVAAAVDNRMELLELELQLAKDQETIDLRENGLLPRLDLDYTYSANGLGSSGGDSLTMVRDRDFEGHSVGLTLQAPLGNKAARSRLVQARYARIERLATRELRELLVRQEVLDAVDAVETGWQRLVANRQRTVLAARNLAAEERMFDQGLRTSTEVLDAQTRLANAQSAEVSSVTEYEIALVELARSTGTLPGASSVEWEPCVALRASE